LGTFFDYIGLDPNPAKDDRVKAPKLVTEEVNPPTAEHFLAIVDAIKQRQRRILFMVVEQGALRLGEAVGCAGATSTAPACGSACRSRRPSATVRGGSTCPSG
jgi:hypothetical protein